MKSFEKVLFLLSVLSIPIQLGKHFWPPFSFVNGIRVDYLSPTLYVSDIFIIALFLVSFLRLKKQLFPFFASPLFLMFTLVFIAGLFFAINPTALGFGILKFVEVSFLGFYIAKNVKKDIKIPFLFVLILTSLVEVIILFLQFFSQHSLGGPFYFLGERTFSSSTIGIATFRFADTLLLRPYGTFPHPNVLAFYLFFVFTLLLFVWKAKEKIFLILKTVTLLFLFFGIIFTFSRIIILLIPGVIFYWLYSQEIKKKKLIMGFVFFALLLLGVALFDRFFLSFVKDSFLRFDLIKISFSIFSSHPLLGIGLNNFYYHEILFQKNITPTLLQPVHNIYLLWLSQTGILGLIPAGLFIKKTFKQLFIKLKDRTSNSSLHKAIVVLLICSLIIGFFDHYLLTLQQGQILMALIFGLSFVSLKELE